LSLSCTGVEVGDGVAVAVLFLPEPFLSLGEGELAAGGCCAG
jgi:hypothetical protein